MKLKPCPNCGCSDRLIKVHILSARLPWWWYIECDNCHWCGSTKLSLIRAELEWNKEAKIMEELYEARALPDERKDYK